MNYVILILLLEDAIIEDNVLLYFIHLWEEKDEFFLFNVVHNFTKHQSNSFFWPQALTLGLQL
jgi:hypothetical protein